MRRERKRTDHMPKNKGTKMVYRIVVRGELSARYAVAFEGMQTKEGRTILSGEVVDQPHLHGILERIGDLGLKLESVQDLSEDVHPSGEERDRELQSHENRQLGFL
jgi:hypothetical protein